MAQRVQRVLILGAAGRDFHDFSVYWRDRPDCEVVGFTATQIPDIHDRHFPAVLAGPRYPDGIPIYSEERLESLIQELKVDVCTLAYSDISYENVMHKAARVAAAGASFTLLSPLQTQLTSRKPVIAVCATRTGCGKSQTTRYLAQILKDMGLRIAAIRHPMPYAGDLTTQIWQRFESVSDLDKHHCTIEEREEYEPHIVAGNLVFAGIDYAKILAEAEKEADVILWDGGNNDMPFYHPNLWITVADPHRAGHESRYYPSEINVRMADVVVLNKLDSADAKLIEETRANIRALNPGAQIVDCDSPLTVANADSVKGKTVLCVEDGPTVTHGEMKYGAATIAAQRLGAGKIVDPRPYASGSLKGTFEKYGHLENVLPAMGYGERQIADLQDTIRQTPCDLVLIGTPINLEELIEIDKPCARVQYDLAERKPGELKAALERVIREPARA